MQVRENDDWDTRLEECSELDRWRPRTAVWKEWREALGGRAVSKKEAEEEGDLLGAFYWWRSASKGSTCRTCLDCGGRSSEVQGFTVQRQRVWDLEEMVIYLSTQVRKGEGKSRALVHKV